MAKPVLPVTGNPDADHLLVEDPLALLLGMLLDQHSLLTPGEGRRVVAASTVALLDQRPTT
ncbi:MAG: hypothetical protein ACSLFO_05915 [Acidimicrobiales bacterium]